MIIIKSVELFHKSCRVKFLSLLLIPIYLVLSVIYESVGFNYLWLRLSSA